MKDRTIQIPIIEKPLTVKEKVYNLISKKDMTTDEVANELEISNRFARECIKLLKLDYSITETKCRCGHTPIYKVK